MLCIERRLYVKAVYFVHGRKESMNLTKRLRNAKLSSNDRRGASHRLFLLSRRFRSLLVGCLILMLSLLSPSARNTHADNGRTFEIQGWQGAMNCFATFPVTLGGNAGDAVHFVAVNCSVTPQSGVVGDVFTVRVSAAGTYSLTAVLTNNESVSDSCVGQAGKTDQLPLTINGWGGARDYYSTFSITVNGGSTNGAITFTSDGCSVTPATGVVGTVFSVTVTRVGQYSLTALMAGDRNHLPVQSTLYSGVSCKSSQSSISISGWKDDARIYDSFEIEISGGSSGEALRLDAIGCTVTHISGKRYEVTVDTVGPYSLTATRAGNYGYNAATVSVGSIATKARPSSLSVSGWSSSKNCNDSFPIRVSGGMPNGVVQFSTVGCSVTPLSGTVDTPFLVTVNSVGSYSLQASMSGDISYMDTESRRLSGTSGKAMQNKLSLENWQEAATTGSSFDVRLIGGGGTGASYVTTVSGCTAVRKAAQEDTYTVTVTAPVGGEYVLRATKTGDANYLAAEEQTYSGKVSHAHQKALAIDHWKDTCDLDETFAVHISGGSGSGAVTFETDGCIIIPKVNGAEGDYLIQVTAAEGESYSLTVNRAADAEYARASMFKSGSVLARSLPRTGDADAGPDPGVDDTIYLLYAAVFLATMAIAVFLLWLRTRKVPRRR